MNNSFLQPRTAAVLARLVAADGSMTAREIGRDPGLYPNGNDVTWAELGSWHFPCPTSAVPQNAAASRSVTRSPRRGASPSPFFGSSRTEPAGPKYMEKKPHHTTRCFPADPRSRRAGVVT